MIKMKFAGQGDKRFTQTGAIGCCYTKAKNSISLLFRQPWRKIDLECAMMEASTDPFADVAELCVYSIPVRFRDAYVPSLTRSVSQAGSTVLSFV